MLDLLLFKYFLSGSNLTNNLLDAIPCNANYNSKEMDDECFHISPTLITLDNVVVQNVSQYFSSRQKYCLEYDTSYNIFSEWRAEGSTWGTAYGSNNWNSLFRVQCRKNGVTKYFYQANEVSPICPSGWTYLSHNLTSGYTSPYTTHANGSKKIATSSCGVSGTDVWYK